MFLKKIPIVYSFGLKIKHYYLSRKTNTQIEHYLQSADIKKIQLGAGQNNLSGWLNTDYFPRNGIYFLDVTKKLPIPSDSFNFIFSEHHIEHIHYKDAKLMISEIYRILKPGGVFRVCTPNLTAYLKSYFEDSPIETPYIKEIINDWIKLGFYNAKNYIPENNEENVSFFVNDIFLNYDHKFIYDYKTLAALLTNAGFTKIVQTNATESEFEELNNIEAHKGLSKPYTLAIEATRE
ncbi:methyltransferase domain-containing protein [Pedobacter sp. Hv1]|uniref:class I SAM-dependent methyltransferase n=1 Tax=Pedobacter sp. Hv1 TaxID=1740090 RepID=UPI0006D89379|nr:methyltransferase domain-containing protein [Pedobacter sp. Hv1]KQC02426.1 hypothetical protein AQF98_02270 [Pedobacter sp. Hv1]